MVVLRAFRPLTAKLSPCGASRHFFGCGLPVLDCLGNGENGVRGNKDGAQWNRDYHFFTSALSSLKVPRLPHSGKAALMLRMGYRSKCSMVLMMILMIIFASGFVFLKRGIPSPAEKAALTRRRLAPNRDGNFYKGYLPRRKRRG